MHKIGRNVVGKLVEWHKQVDRKPLLIRGARQVGKTWVVVEWCRLSKLRLITINFEEQPRYAELFEKDLNIERIIDDLTTYFGLSLRAPDVVLFFDEIQSAPKAITALRYFYEKAPEMAVVAAGSLIEFALHWKRATLAR